MRKEVTEVYRVPLGTSARKNGENVEGREQTTGRKETPKQKNAFRAHIPEGGKVRREQCGVPPESRNI
jgi:hypothetical protein